jgi:hypothetical protein
MVEICSEKAIDLDEQEAKRVDVASFPRSVSYYFYSSSLSSPFSNLTKYYQSCRQSRTALAFVSDLQPLILSLPHPLLLCSFGVHLCLLGVCSGRTFFVGGNFKSESLLRYSSLPRYPTVNDP